MASQWGNCPKCGKLFVRVRNICHDCFQKQEDEFKKAVDYLYEHRGCTIQELSEGTGVSITQIRQFIWAGRIIVEHFPNLSYPCESCGTPITTGRKCNSCLGTLNKLAAQVQKSEIGVNQKGNTQDYKGLRLMTRSNSFDKQQK